MLSLKRRLLMFKLTHILILSGLLFLSSCMPTATTAKLDANSSTTDSNSGTNAGSYKEPIFPFSSLFIQEGATQSTSNTVIPIDFSDSFLIRGDALSKYLRTIPNTTKLCLVGKFNYVSNKDKFLILTAKPKSYTDLTKKTSEFYLQVEPANDSANQNDCLSYNLTNALYQNASSPTASFSFTQLCTDCTTTVTSSSLKLYFLNGEALPTVNVSSLSLTISGYSTSSANGCSESTACKARGFDCCLQSQCVNDGALRPGASSAAGIESAQEDVKLNPMRFVVYPQFYFVCETRPQEDPDNTEDETINPDYAAALRITELQHLYNCLNKVDGEFSLCTLKFTEASASIPGVFSGESSGYYDDINFSGINTHLGSGDYANSIHKIVYAGQTLYEQNVTPLSDGTFGATNDDLSSTQSVTVTALLPDNAQDANLYLTYKVDGTCEKLGSTMAKCTKSYIQDYSNNKSSMYHDSSLIFKLPTYADASSDASIIVKISGVVIPEDDTTWSKSESPPKITFNSSYPIYQNQLVEITYFIKNATYVSRILKLRTDAQAKVNTMCTCASSSKCNLKPVMDATNTSIVNYECLYETPTTSEPPVNQTVYVSNKNIAHRYFDTNGVSYDDYANANGQEQTLTGKAFEYTNNNLLKPNNLSSYVGFNEIYGSFAKSGTYVARPAKAVSVKKDKMYDIVVSSGVFSSCTSCGSDYYSSLQKIFPQNFAAQGGGYSPDNYETRREGNTSLYRADDLLFGRACFTPATMIPWTHVTATTAKDQRRSRLSAQHFLFANGYNRDWYGFDYGSLIGSFDGVTWFSIGNQRRIKATTGKLYLAINSYIGDLNVDSNFNINIGETTTYSSDIPDHDTESDGAQCQKSHYCSNDNDCFRQLGFDYTCQNVASLTTKWPMFDSSGSEIVGSSLKTILSIVGGSNGQAKRCIYRGKGAPCLNNLDLAGTGTHFNSSSSVGHLMCSPNSTCLPITTANKFNNRIARFGATPVAQNSNLVTPTTDTVGLGARVILRPFEYYGSQTIPTDAKAALELNNVNAICVPGKDISSATDNYDLNSKFPNSRIDSSDKILGVGPTSSSTLSSKALSACPATDTSGVTMQVYDLSLTDSTLTTQTITQNMSSNLLDNVPLKNLNIFSSTSGSQITSIGYQRNTCLRSPGASCFSDMECAPSGFIGAKARISTLSTILNAAEVKFWEEDLICGNSQPRYLSPGILNTAYDLKKNVCCRETGKLLTVTTQTDSSTHQWCDSSGNILVAGVNINLASSTRYSRVHTVYDKMTCNRSSITSTKSFALSLAASSSTDRLTQVLGQYKTLDTLNQRTCCTQHWVRNFSADNGSGHTFSKTKMQNIDKAMFKHVSWGADDETTIVPAVGDNAFECKSDQYLNSSCEIKSLTPSEETKYLSWASTLELIGIPQVAIKTNDQIYKLVNDSQADISGSKLPLTDSDGKDIFITSSGTVDFTDASSLKYYSAANYTAMNMTDSSTKNSMKKVFSENEFNCCIPSGQQVTDTTTSEQCCTGYKANLNGQNRCCLPDYTDITVYLNRYVSSEGRGLPDTAYDTSTGYIKDPGQVKLMAAQKNLCCSGNAMMGVAISQLPIPLDDGAYLPPDSTTTTRRFNYRTDGVDNNSETGSIGSIFDAGIRWNNHVYCVPSGFGN